MRALRDPAEPIKDAILHPDPEIRDRATSDFARAYSDDAFRAGMESQDPARRSLEPRGIICDHSTR
jgi:hypothetical protein